MLYITIKVKQNNDIMSFSYFFILIIQNDVIHLEAGGLEMIRFRTDPHAAWVVELPEELAGFLQFLGGTGGPAMAAAFPDANRSGLGQDPHTACAAGADAR